MNDENLTPWQKQHIEYERKKAAEQGKTLSGKKPKKKKIFKKEKAQVENEKSFENKAEQVENDNQEESEEKLDQTFDQLIKVEEDEKIPFLTDVAPVFKKMWWVLLIVFLVFVGSIYAVSPLSKIGAFSVTGNVNETTQEVTRVSALQKSDTIYGIIKGHHQIEQRITKAFPRVKSVALKVHFPNKVEAVVTEYHNAVYVQQKGKNYLVLENGYIIKNQTVPNDKLAHIPLLKNFSDSEVQTFVKDYESLKPDLAKLITTVTKTPTTATPDFIALDMSDGNQVRVPLSQMSVKLPYYPSVAKQITAPQVVDMEAGIYAKSKTAYQEDLSSISTSIADSISVSQSIKAQKDEQKAANNNNTTVDTTTAQGQ
jgi:cell division protein FtsQ